MCELFESVTFPASNWKYVLHGGFGEQWVDPYANIAEPPPLAGPGPVSIRYDELCGTMSKDFVELFEPGSVG